MVKLDVNCSNIHKETKAVSGSRGCLSRGAPLQPLSRERLKTPGEMRRKGILLTLLGSAKKSEPGLNIHCCILHVGVLFARAEGKEPR